MEWRDVVGYEGIYEVSDTGLVRTHKNKTTHSNLHGLRNWKQRILKQKVSKNNSHRVTLYKNKQQQTWLVHRLVTIAFIPLIEGKDYVNHIDGDRHNNNVSNLEWCNHIENINHAFDTGLVKTGENISLIDKSTGEETSFRSMAKAGLFLGKSHSYIHGLLKRGITETDSYFINRKLYPPDRER